MIVSQQETILLNQSLSGNTWLDFETVFVLEKQNRIGLVLEDHAYFVQIEINLPAYQNFLMKVGFQDCDFHKFCHDTLSSWVL
jgi:hypothetical protein